MTKLQVVRASDAHSWVEAWIAGHGWTTFDPTPADPGSAGEGALARLSLFFDAAEQFWQDWVVGYDPDRQIALASRMDESTRRLGVGWITAWVNDTVASVTDWTRRANHLRGYAPIAVITGTLLLSGDPGVRRCCFNGGGHKCARGDWRADKGRHPMRLSFINACWRCSRGAGSRNRRG